MPIVITKIRLINYKRFRDYTIEPNRQTNILVGDDLIFEKCIYNIGE